MEKIPVSILLWIKYSHLLEETVDKLKRFYKMEVTAYDVVGCGEIRGSIFEKDIKSIEENLLAVNGVFKDSDFPKRPPIQAELEISGFLPGNMGAEETTESKHE
jgi:hypothetical protein